MTLDKRLKEIRGRISASQNRTGLSHYVEVVGVTKTHPFEIIHQSFQAGIKSIGENRVQEAVSKFQTDKELLGLKKRFIGHLQSNKTKKCVSIFDTIDSIDSIKTLRKVSKTSRALNKKISVLIEINTSGESQKNGFHTYEKEEVLNCFEEEPDMVRGLMTIGPNIADKNKIRQSFRKLRQMKEELTREKKEIKIKHLSMGMSGDYEIAVEEGSTMVRIGSLLYGKRTF